MKLIDVSTLTYPNKFAKVDDSDYESLDKVCWGVTKHRNTFYAQRQTTINNKKTSVRMHREVMGFPDCQIDHIDGDGLNNQRTNLRRSTNQLNQFNQINGATLGRHKSSKYKGVVWNKLNRKWIAQIMVNRINYGLGYFKSEETAARAYDAAAREKFGSFARLNFPNEISRELRALEKRP